MMTFILFRSFNLTSIFLDKQRLGKQRIEARMILDILMGNIKSKAWTQHPITKSWQYFIMDDNYNSILNKSYKEYTIRALKYYINCIINSFIRKGCTNNYEIWEIKCDSCLCFTKKCKNKYIKHKCSICGKDFKLYLPWWTYWKPYIQSNIASLLRKNPTYYQKFIKKLKYDKRYSDYGYIWPNTINKLNYMNSFKIASPIMLDNVNIIYCQAIIKNGKRLGEKCGNIVRNKKYTPDNERQFCGMHKTKYNEKVCNALKINGDLCGKKFKSNFDYCGIHIKKYLLIK